MLTKKGGKNMLKKVHYKLHKILCLFMSILLVCGALPIKTLAESSDENHDSAECIVAYDPDDGKTQYKDFYKTTVHKGDKVTDIPEDPKRDGYIFKGWYAYLDEDNNPAYWSFEEDEVKENTTLWADWEEGCIVAYDPDDGKTQYKDFYKTTVHKGDKVTDIPEDPKRDGYIFKGWYAYLDEDNNPVYWSFEEDEVKENTTLLADWEKREEKPEEKPEKPKEKQKKKPEDKETRDKSNGHEEELVPNEENPLGLVKDNHITYVQGYPEGDFRPERPITRAEAAQIFYNLLTGVKKTGYSSSFSDVKSSSWYADAIYCLSANNIISGYPNGTYKPNEYITRAEFATIAAKFDNFSSDNKKSFIDLASSHWAYKYIMSASDKGWINGYPDNTFKPEKNITRSEVVKMVNNILERGIKSEGIPVNLHTLYRDLTIEHWSFADIIEASVEHSYTRDKDGWEIWK